MSADDESPPHDRSRANPKFDAPRPNPTLDSQNPSKPAHRGRRARREPLVASPHDAFFRAIFSRPEEAAGLVRFMLPAPLGDALDASSIRVLSPTHIDSSLHASQSDVVVAARLAEREVRFVAILEHRSTVESRMALRLWRYSGEAWAREGGRRGPLPDVIPLVVYAGKRPWTAPRDLAGLLAPTDDPALAALRPRFAYLLEDLTQRSPDTLRVGVLGVLGALALATLRAAQRGGIRGAVHELAPLVAGLAQVRDGASTLLVVIRYLLTVLPADEQPLVHDVVAALPDPEKEEAVKKVKTIADAIREEAEARVRAEVEARIVQERADAEARIRAERAGALRRVRASVEKQLRLKFGALTAHATERLEQASLDDLDGIAERLLFAPSLDAALDGR
jgi:hypothetical protein